MEAADRGVLYHTVRPYRRLPSPVTPFDAETPFENARTHSYPYYHTYRSFPFSIQTLFFSSSLVLFLSIPPHFKPASLAIPSLGFSVAPFDLDAVHSSPVLHPTISAHIASSINNPQSIHFLQRKRAGIPSIIKNFLKKIKDELFFQLSSSHQRIIASCLDRVRLTNCVGSHHHSSSSARSAIVAPHHSPFAFVWWASLYPIILSLSLFFFFF